MSQKNILETGNSDGLKTHLPSYPPGLDDPSGCSAADEKKEQVMKTIYSINHIGRAAIRDWLETHHYMDIDYLNLDAFCAEAECNMNSRGVGLPIIELAARESAREHAETFTVPAAGINAKAVEDCA